MDNDSMHKMKMRKIPLTQRLNEDPSLLVNSNPLCLLLFPSPSRQNSQPKSRQNGEGLDAIAFDS
jgi:hypothetical protein